MKQEPAEPEISMLLESAEYQRAEQMAVRTACGWYGRYRGRIPTSLDAEDFQQAARICVWKAARAYSPAYGARFSTFALRLLRFQLLRLTLRQVQGCSKEDWLQAAPNSLLLSLDHLVNEDQRYAERLVDKRCPPEREGTSRCLEAQVRLLLREFPHQKAGTAFEMVVFQGMQHREVELRLGVTRLTVSRWNRSVSRWLQQKLQVDAQS